ncbi:DUF192 domain-containing protein [Mesobacillus harenae]|uniref:DUF192 domain-containing protein n=1 Tax=Mesobacillus harenae TaxID=2213203 RepID=UPI00158110BD|nr:DUF192 domain-containing protein [Mesobacillus harenae]
MMSEAVNKSFPFTIKVADHFTSRLRGLMFRKRPLDQEGLWITPCNSIHMCFMNFAIDAVFIDRGGRVVKLINNLQPWKFVKPVKGAYSVIELPEGTISRLKITEGQQINF